MNNLLSNAVKFTSKGEITLSVSYSSSRLHIDVTDTGKGMAAKDRERIFQEFTRLPGAQGEEGFGLGLSIVHKLVTLLEGTIDVRSVVGEGSTFTVILPLYPVGKALSDYKDKKQSVINNTNTVPAAEEDEGTQLPVPAANILLIDDDKIQLTLTAAMLEQQGIHATCCEQLDELTEQLRENHFDVLLTDVQMPAINGFDLLKLLRASNIPQAKTIPIIAVTARSDMNEAEFLEHGFAGCLHKPFTVKELLQTINEGQLVADEAHITEDMGSGLMNFSALTVYSEDDPEAACSIIETFIEETEKNIDIVQQALDNEDTDGIAAMAHKLLPLFTLIGASETIAPLKYLESCRGEMFVDEIKQTTLTVLATVPHIISEAKEYLSYRYPNLFSK